mgnify:CR=1 FL=1
MKNKLLIVGFDALSWEYMNFLIARGNLPNFSNLRKNSTYGPLESVYPPGTYIAWPTFMTGVNPGKSSLFYPLLFKEKFSYSATHFETSQIGFPTIYEFFSDKFSVGVVNHPAAYPPIEVNGFFISKPPSQKSSFSFPDSMKDEILSLFPDFGKPLKRNSNPKVTLKDAMEKLSLNYEVSKYCFNNHDMDIKSTIFMEVDSFSHWYWDRPELIDKIYQHCDKILGFLISDFPSHNILVLSDHGFGRCLSIFHPNVWLEKMGLLKWKSGHFNSFKKSKFSRILSKFSKDKSNNKFSKLSESIDWSNTKVYFREDMGFRFNLLGREKHGIVTKSEASKIFNLISEEIINVKDSNFFDNTPFKGLIKNKDVFFGPHVARSPDFYLDVSDNYHRGFSCDNNDSIFEPNLEQPGKHSMNGIYFLKSEDINSGMYKELNIIDLMPNLLYLMDVKSRKYFDGKFHKDLYKNSILSERKFTESDEDSSFNRDEQKITDKDRDDITEFWKDVGYL